MGRSVLAAVLCVVCSYSQMVVRDCELGLIPSVLQVDNSTAWGVVQNST